MINSMIQQRKFILALLFTISSIVALFFGVLGGGEFISIITIILGVYGASNAIDKHIEKKNVK